MLRKLRVSLLLQPLATALFANSPFTEGRPNGFLSYRAYVWLDTDNDRSGIPRVMFEPGFGFERYVEWLVDHVPMYFVYRNGSYIDVAGASFRDFMAGRLHNVVGTDATVGDFADHITTVFTDVRIKRFLEMRGADAGRADMMVAQSAFWVGPAVRRGGTDRRRGAVARRDLGGCRGVAHRRAARGTGRILARRQLARPGARRHRHLSRRVACQGPLQCGWTG